MVPFLFASFAIAGSMLALQAGDQFGRMLGVGIVTWLSVQALVNIGGELRVNLLIDPPLSQQHHFIVLLDGSPVTPPSRSRSLLLREVYRGEHTVQVVIQRAGGEEVTRTPAVSFFVRQTSIAN